MLKKILDREKTINKKHTHSYTYNVWIRDVEME